MTDLMRLDETGLSWVETDDGMVVLDLATSRYLAVNESGRRLWPVLVQGSTRDALADTLVTAFGVDAEQALADVDAFVAALTQRGLLRHQPV
jgi:Coenzyme PQQ synthesis protein D (PqqD)